MTSRRRTASRSRLLWAVGLLALPAPSRAAPDPCTLLTPAQVTAAVGGAFGAGEAIPGSKTVCTWVSNTPHLIVTLSLYPAKDWDRLTTPLPGATVTPTGGLGDAAAYATLEPYTMLYVRKGPTAFLIKVYGEKDHAKQRSAEKTLATDVLKKL